VDPVADRDVIQAAYRQLARKYHPDRGLDLPADAAGKMVEINAAWELLGDPERRADFDRERAAAARTPIQQPSNLPHSDPTGPVGPTRPGGSSPTAAPPPVTHDGQWAGPPPGRASGSILNFGRYSGWSLGEISRFDPAYLDWLERMPIGRTYRSEVQALLRNVRKTAEPATPQKKGMFGRG
ncbi:MAG: J domain-containing protein, partial [Candidatus Limnocylindrales bacterium]